MTPDEKMKKLIDSNEKYWNGSTHQEGPVIFYKVGRNASHDFFVGQIGFAFLVYSVGENYDENGKSFTSRRISAYQSFDELYEKAYLGHY